MRVTPLAVLVLVGCGAAHPTTRATYFDEDHVEAINGTRLHYRVRGWDRRHPYLVLLHGGPGGSALPFYPWGASLEHAVNVVYLDQRGAGLSQRARFADPAQPTPEEAAPFAIANQLRDLEGVRAQLGVTRWHVLGHSYGGMLGVEYVVAHPERVISYIHMDGLLSVPMIDEDWLAYAERALRETARLDPASTPRTDALQARVAALRALPQDERDRELDGVLGELRPERLRDRLPGADAYDARLDAELRRYGVSPAAMSAPEPGLALGVAEHFATRDVLALLPRVTRPTLVIGGVQDPIVPPGRAELAHARIPGSRLVLIDQAGHDPFKDQPDAVTRAVLAHVAP